MADPVLELDAAGSNIDGTNPGTAMLLVDATTGWGLTAFDAPQPESKLLWTSSIDTDGSRRADPGNYENRTITATLGCERSTAALLQAQLRILGMKIGKINREGGPTGVGGTLKVTYPSGNSFIFDLLTASHNFTFDDAFVLGNLAQVTVSFTALPGARGAEQDLGDNVEATLSALIFTEASIPGDLPALGQAVIDNDASADWHWLIWGGENDADYTHTTSSGSGALFYEAESRTPLGGAATAIGSGASGGGSNIVEQGTLTSTYQAMLSTQALGGGAHLSHVGTFRVFARVQLPASNTGAVSLALEWAVGDFRSRTTNPAVSFDVDPSREGQWLIVNLGLVTIAKTSQGTHRWEGRIIAKSTIAGDDLDVDWIALVPTGHGYGEARSVTSYETPTTFLARDEFDQTAGALTGKTVPVGGTWTVVAGSDADDFTVETTGKTAQRTAVSDATGAGRLVTAGTTAYGATGVQVDIKRSAATTCQMYVAARTASLSDLLVAGWDGATSSWAVYHLSGGGGRQQAALTYEEDLPVGEFWTIRFIVGTTGRWAFWRFRQGGAAGQPLLVGTLNTIAEAATGPVGIYDEHTSATACTRTYDNFAAFTPTTDAAVYADQSLQLTHEGVEREDSSGAIWSRVSSYTGSYLRPPPAGQEARNYRMIVLPSRNDPDTMSDPAIDDISAKLYVTPRYLVVPSA